MTTQECKDLYTQLFLAVLPAVAGGFIARGGTFDSAEVAMDADDIADAAFYELSRSLDNMGLDDTDEDDGGREPTPLLDALKRNALMQ